MSNEFASIMCKIGWGVMITGGMLLVSSIIWIFTLPTPIADSRIITVIENTIPLGCGGIILIGGVIVYFALMDMASHKE